MNLYELQLINFLTEITINNDDWVEFLTSKIQKLKLKSYIIARTNIRFLTFIFLPRVEHLLF